MTTRRALAVGGLLVLVGLSGCLGFGGGVDSDDLTQEATYDWNTSANATYNVTSQPLLSFDADSYRAVIDLENRTTASLSRDTLFRGDEPVSIRALKFRFPNGTIVNATHRNLTASSDSQETEIAVPAANGTVAYTATWGSATSGFSGSPRTWRVQTPVEGSHEVVMPDGARTDIPLLSLTSPGGHETTVENNRATLYWADLDSGTVTVRYYLLLDLYIFGGLFAIAGLVGLGGVLHYYRGIQRAQKKRQEVGLDVEQDDDDIGDDGPPPGVR